MYPQLIANIKTNLKFYIRNRLLLAAAIFTILVLGMSIIPSIIFFSMTKHLEIVRTIFSQLNSFATIVTAGLGLLLIYHHINNRSTKMVFTKPCLPDVWLLSSFFSASLVSFILFSGTLLICSTLFLIWNIPFQGGIIYITINEFLQAIILLSYITFLSIILHPVLVVLIIFIFSEGTFYYLKIFLVNGLKAGGDGNYISFLKALKGFADVIYILIPSFSPFSEETAKIYSSLRLSDARWDYLLLTLAYTLLISSLFYFLSVYFLKRKRHI